METISLQDYHHGRRKPPTVFDGELVAQVDTNADRAGDGPDRDRWSVYKLYRTRAGAWVLHTEAHSVIPDQEAWHRPYELVRDPERLVEALCRVMLDPLRKRAGMPPWTTRDGISGPGFWMVRLLLERAGLFDEERRVE